MTLIYICVALMLVPTVLMALFGSFIFYKVFAEDSSNRLNHMRLVWFTLNAPHKCAELYYYDDEGYVKPAFPWLKRDEGDNVDGIG